MSKNPFETAAPQAPQAPQTEAAPVNSEKTKKSGGPRKTPAPQLTEEDRKYIVDNYANTNTAEIAKSLSQMRGREVTKQQVYRTVLDFRKKLQEMREEATKAGDQGKVTKIDELLTKVPEKEFGGGRGGGKKGSSIDSLIDSLL